MQTEKPIVKTADESDFPDWIAALVLLRDAIRADLSYEHATSYCSDCPRRDHDYNPFADFRNYVSPECCKDNGGWSESHESDFQHIDKIEKAIAALKSLLPDDSVN